MCRLSSLAISESASIASKDAFLTKKVYAGFDKPAEGESFGKKYCKATDLGKTGSWSLIA